MTAASSWTTTALLRGLAIATVFSCTVTAMPSFGLRIPNGERVPCSSSTSEEMAAGCSRQGYCLGLGHHQCDGVQPDDVTLESTTEETRLVSLNPFGDDFKTANYEWTRALCLHDSDQDGRTNGEELGDPCCTWFPGQIGGTALEEILEGWVPTHPGIPNDSFEFSYDRRTVCGDDDDDDDNDVRVEEPGSVADDYYTDQETRGEWELLIQPYPIPIQTTTYTDFLFRLPDEFPDLVHIVYGAVILSQPKHLHHFVVTGCTRVPDAKIPDGVPIESPPRDCSVQLGGWAPGTPVFGNDKNDLSVGVALGRAMGIEAIQLNIHYTDGEYEDAAEEVYKLAVDGIKIYYTPDLRPYTAMSKQVLAVPWGPKEMVIPPNVDRHFLTRTCRVETKCKDATDETLQAVSSFLNLNRDGGDGGDDLRDRVANRGSTEDRVAASDEKEPDDAKEQQDEVDDDDGSSASATATDGAAMNAMFANLSCSSIKMFCFLGDFALFIQQLCPQTCGLCDTPTTTTENDDTVVNPRDPQRYRGAAIHYHAHLLGNEMYATLLRPTTMASSSFDQQDISQQEITATKKQLDLTEGVSSSGTSNPNNMLVKDLKSREVWYYDDQAGISFDKEFTIDVNTNDDEDQELVRGLEIRPGDKIQATCVFNSKDRTENTRFGLSTYDEMCIIGIDVVFETPVVDTAISLIAELNLRLFSCANDNENHTTDIWQGTLEADEDPRNIWKDHPIEDSEQCIFSVEDYVFIELMTGGSRNCPSDMDNGAAYAGEICYGFVEDDDSEIDFLAEEIAGYTCEGGTYDQKDSNEEPLYVTQNQCIQEGGGSSYIAYTCSDLQYWFDNEASTSIGMTDEVIEYLRTEWYQPKCCRLIVDDVDTIEASPSLSPVVSIVPSASLTEAGSSSLSFASRHYIAYVAVIMMASILVTLY